MLLSSGDETGKPINIKISKASKIRNLFTKKLTMLANDMTQERLDQFLPAERFFVELVDSYKPNELVEYL